MQYFSKLYTEVQYLGDVYQINALGDETCNSNFSFTLHYEFQMFQPAQIHEYSNHRVADMLVVVESGALFQPDSTGTFFTKVSCFVSCGFVLVPAVFVRFLAVPFRFL